MLKKIQVPVFIIACFAIWLRFLINFAAAASLNSKIDIIAGLIVTIAVLVFVYAGCGFFQWSHKLGRVLDSLPIWIVAGLLLIVGRAASLLPNIQVTDGFYTFVRLSATIEWLFYLWAVFVIHRALMGNILSYLNIRIMLAAAVLLSFLFITNETGDLDITRFQIDHAPRIWHLAEALFISLAVAWLLFRIRAKPYIDIAVFFAIWIIAAVIWIQTPLGVDYFYNGTSASGQYLYPLSDARQYDYEASKIAFGFDEYVDLSSRGNLLYFFALLKRLLGFSTFTLMITQSILLGAIPGLVYLITRKLNAPQFTAILAATLIIIKEMLVIRSDLGSISVMTQMTEPLFELGVLLAVLALISALKSDNPGKHYLILGAVAGFFALVRPNALVLLVIPFFFWLPNIFKKPSIIARWAVLLLIGFGLASLPIVVRNVANGYSVVYFSGKLGIASERMGVPENIEQLLSGSKKRSRQPTRATRFKNSAQVNNTKPVGWQNLTRGTIRLLAYPMDVTPKLINNSLINYIMPPEKAKTSAGQLFTVILVFSNLAINAGLIIIGFRRAKLSVGRAAIVPLAVFLIYLPTILFSSAIVARHMAPIENLFFIYYAFGVTVFFGDRFALTTADAKTSFDTKLIPYRFLVPLILLVSAIFPMVGALAPMAVVGNYTADSMNAIPAVAFNALKEANISDADLRAFLLGQPTAELAIGRILYPTFETEKLFNKPMDSPYAHLEFRLIDDYQITQAVFAVQQPLEIANGSAVIALLCKPSTESATLVALRLIDLNTMTFYIRDPDIGLVCSPPMSE